jgi:hypothetical protein
MKIFSNIYNKEVLLLIHTNKLRVNKKKKISLKNCQRTLYFATIGKNPQILLFNTTCYIWSEGPYGLETGLFYVTSIQDWDWRSNTPLGCAILVSEGKEANASRSMPWMLKKLLLIYERHDVRQAWQISPTRDKPTLIQQAKDTHTFAWGPEKSHDSRWALSTHDKKWNKYLGPIK